MAEPINIFITGNTMKIMMDDDSFYLCHPAGGQRWIVGQYSNSDEGGEDNPGTGTGDFRQPFPWSGIEGPWAEYGPRDGTRWHEGTDWAGGLNGGPGTDIKCAGDGVVTYRGINLNSAYGNHVIVDHGVMETGLYAGKRVRTLYAHMQNPPPVSLNSSVIKGQIIGALGNTGTASFGAHLHFEVHVSGPSEGIVHNLQNDGGYRTAVNSRDFFAAYGG